MKYEATITTLMRRAVLLVVIVSMVVTLLILPGCNTAEEAPTTRRIPFEYLSDYRTSYTVASTLPGLMVVTDPKDCAWGVSLSRQFVKDSETIDIENNIVLGVGLCLDSYQSFRVKSIELTGTDVTVEVERFDPHPDGARLCVFIPKYEHHLYLIQRASFWPNGEFHFVLLDTVSGEESAEVTAVVEAKGPVYTREIPVERLFSTRRATGKDCLVITNQNQYKWAITDWAKEAFAKIMPEIDFNRYILLAVSGEVPDSCYTLSIVDPAIQDGTRIQVMVEIEMESDFGIATVIPTTTFVLAERDSFLPRGELQFVFHVNGMNGEQVVEKMASV